MSPKELCHGKINNLISYSGKVCIPKSPQIDVRRCDGVGWLICRGSWADPARCTRVCFAPCVVFRCTCPNLHSECAKDDNFPRGLDFCGKKIERSLLTFVRSMKTDWANIRRRKPSCVTRDTNENWQCQWVLLLSNCELFCFDNTLPPVVRYRVWEAGTGGREIMSTTICSRLLMIFYFHILKLARPRRIAICDFHISDCRWGHDSGTHLTNE